MSQKKDSKKILKKKITILTAKDIKLSYIKISKKFFPKQQKYFCYNLEQTVKRQLLFI